MAIPAAWRNGAYMLEDVTPASSTNDDLPKPPAGRRSSTRPAGPPAPVTFNEGTPPPKRTRPTRTRTKPSVNEAPAETPVETPAEAPAAETPAPETTAADAPAEKPATRRRTPKKSTSKKPATQPAAETVVETPAEAPVEDVEPAVAEPMASITSDVDAALAAAREAASKSPRKRGVNKKAAQALLGDEADGDLTSDEVLASLAAAIAGTLGEDADVADEEEAEATEAESDAESEEAADEAADETEAADEATETDDTDEPAEADAEADEESTPTPRRRRRRGGRRRRRSSENAQAAAEASESDDDEHAESDDHDDDHDDHADDAESSDDSPSETGTRRRRRRRRRRGEDVSGSDDDPSDVVVRVREPRTRSARAVADEVTGIEGSTRMEAKRQRRRDGRAAGRRRAPILTEAEFLARRESVERTMVIRQRDDYTQIAVLEDGVLVEHYVDRASAASLIGNIYLGKVQNVLPSMEAAFIDIGRGRNAVLYAGEVDWDSYDATGANRKVEQVLKSGQPILVQVSKDPVGAKGARLTGHVSLPGRYVVYSPDGHLSGISRKLPDTERQRLKGILSDAVGDDASVIVRTAAEGASEAELVRDVERLKAQWEVIEKLVKQGGAPQALYSEPDLTLRIVRDLFTEDFGSLVIAGNGGADDAYDSIKAYVDHVAPHLAERISRWDVDEQGDPFVKYRVDEQVAKALERKVFLPSGGSLVIDRTEAMTVIDVNTGKFTGTGGNLEETVTKNNLEAAEEVVRQLRLRDIGGIVMIDFIDMVLPANRELLLRRLVECLGRDRTRHQVSEVTSLGLVQMTRKKIGTGLAEAFTEQCECCGGRGYIRHDEPVDSQSQADGGERKHNGRRSGRSV